MDAMHRWLYEPASVQLDPVSNYSNTLVQLCSEFQESMVCVHTVALVSLKYSIVLLLGKP